MPLSSERSILFFCELTPLSFLKLPEILLNFKSLIISKLRAHGSYSKLNTFFKLVISSLSLLFLSQISILVLPVKLFRSNKLLLYSEIESIKTFLANNKSL